jgi:hypothetical protein
VVRLRSVNTFQEAAELPGRSLRDFVVKERRGTLERVGSFEVDRSAGSKLAI